MSQPEDIVLLPMGDLGHNQVIGKIEQERHMGDRQEYTVMAAERRLVLQAGKKEDYPVGGDVRLAFDPDRMTVLPR